MLALTKSILSIIHGLLKAILLSFMLDVNSYGQALTISPYFRCEDKYYLPQIRTSSESNQYLSVSGLLSSDQVLAPFVPKHCMPSQGKYMFKQQVHDDFFDRWVVKH